MFSLPGCEEFDKGSLAALEHNFVEIVGRELERGRRRAESASQEDGTSHGGLAGLCGDEARAEATASNELAFVTQL